MLKFQNFSHETKVTHTIPIKMSVVAVLGDLKKFAKNKPRADVSNTIFKLHRLTAALLIGCSILTTSRQFFGDPIHCMLGGGSIPLNVFQSYCFMTGTYTLPHVTSIPLNVFQSYCFMTGTYTL